MTLSKATPTAEALELPAKLEKPFAERFAIKKRSPAELKPEKVKRGSLEVIVPGTPPVIPCPVVSTTLRDALFGI